MHDSEISCRRPLCDYKTVQKRQSVRIQENCLFLLIVVVVVDVVIAVLLCFSWGGSGGGGILLNYFSPMGKAVLPTDYTIILLVPLSPIDSNSTKFMIQIYCPLCLQQALHVLNAHIEKWQFSIFPEPALHSRVWSQTLMSNCLWNCFPTLPLIHRNDSDPIRTSQCALFVKNTVTLKKVLPLQKICFYLRILLTFQGPSGRTHKNK